MSEIKIKYLHLYTDVRGKQRCYFNKKGYPKTPLPLPDDPKFMEAYAKAIRQEKPISFNRIKPDSFAALIRSYKNSNDFRILADETKRTYLRFLNILEETFGHLPGCMTTREVNKIRLKQKHMPDQSNRILSILRIIYKNALQEDLVDEDPTVGLSPLKTGKTKGFRTWTEEEIKTYLDHWKLGTREHLALQCILQTSQRRSDIVRFSFETIQNGRIVITQSKTGTNVYIPILPSFQAALDLLEYETGPILRTKFGKPFTAAGFGNWFRDTVNKAGLEKGLSPHGLRKAMCTRLANAGCSPYEIMAISGHLTLSEVTRYTMEVDRKRLAGEATEKLLNDKSC